MLFIPGFIAGALTSGTPWTQAEITIIDNVDNLTTSRCTTYYKFALAQYEVVNDCVGIEEKDAYDSNTCNKRFEGTDICTLCKNGGNAILAMATLGTVAAICGSIALLAKYCGGPYYNALYSLQLRCASFTCFVLVSAFALMCWAIWLNPCFRELVDYVDNFPESLSTESNVWLGGGWSLVFTAWIFSILLAVMEAIPLCLQEKAKEGNKSRSHLQHHDPASAAMSEMKDAGVSEVVTVVSVANPSELATKGERN
eukprot:CAMPEP_0185261292 /NCGR_PEP_ID=MMETSP1359-20130426/9705_1 /TAXON_ID=552665 /ORGANISM="Bigelowiella longifila, Strain CCMP242" /LENGTH=254 /DNA_ID=CAMNT_0027847853 /DNA_START=98 /DNA_END=862 /DNA_ORIENTATION=+